MLCSRGTAKEVESGRQTLDRWFTVSFLEGLNGFFLIQQRTQKSLEIWCFFFFFLGVLNKEFLPSVNKIKISCLLGWNENYNLLAAHQPTPTHVKRLRKIGCLLIACCECLYQEALRCTETISDVSMWCSIQAPTQHVILYLLCRWGTWPQSIHLWGRELGFSTIFFWCVDMCIYVSVCVYVCMNIWKAEVDFGCLPQLFPPYFLRQGFTQNLKLPRSARLAAQ